MHSHIQNYPNGSVIAAAEAGHTKVVEALLDAGADVNARDIRKTTPLIIASFKGWTDTVATLLSRQASINLSDMDECTALIAAARGGNTEIIKLLVEKSADISRRTSDGATALHEAARFGWPRAIEVLIDRGFAIEERRHGGGHTALTLAVYRADVETVRVLLSRGARFNLYDKVCSEALAYALRCKCDEIAEMLRSNAERC